MSAREDIAINITQQLQNMTQPAPGLVSRKYFDVVKLAITQFPAILVVTTTEDREDVSMDLRRSKVQYILRCYLRGTELDTERNLLVERIEETLEQQRGRNVSVNSGNIHNVTTRISNIQIVEREIPLGEVVVTVDVFYTYKKGVL